ncbi:hypothetical protein ZIOFF_039377 [Zingiber officinale]|uniref:DUF7032 domain-containing protein n=1 Tax=Zingiber officinale TaxID=94328 RepID=A0A8J5L048_ZINOF|nr:hypothetical protein ZIOFF_039377 [Zingiber officinale]
MANGVSSTPSSPSSFPPLPTPSAPPTSLPTSSSAITCCLHCSLPHLTSGPSPPSASTRSFPPDLPGGKLRLQSDIDIVASALSLHCHHLHLLLCYDPLHHDASLASSTDDFAAIVLLLPAPSASRAILTLFVCNIFAHLQIDALDLKGKALDSLLELLAADPTKISRLVVEEEDLPSLLRLLDPSIHSLLRNSTTVVVSLLATTSDVSHCAVFEGGALSPLLHFLDSGLTVLKERAATVIHTLTADHARII